MTLGCNTGDTKKPCAFEGQSLESHVAGMLKLVERLPRNYYLAAVARFKAYHICISADDAKELVRTLIVMHDFGKAYSKYQNSFDDGCKCIRGEGKCNFYGHETLSAYATHSLFRGVQSLKTLVTLAVIRHHEAARDLLLNPFRSGDQCKIAQQDIETLRSLLSNCSRWLDSSKLNEIQFVTEQKLYRFIKEFGDTVMVSGAWLKLYSVLLAPLMAADKINASEDRETVKRDNAYLKASRAYFGVC
jgi:CRISPR-associated endonuclease Cas3-HD